MGRRSGRGGARGAGMVAALAVVTWAAAGARWPGQGADPGGGGAGDDACLPVPADAPSAREALRGAEEAMGASGPRPLRFRAVQRTVQDFQSDRTYPPFFASFDIQEITYDPTTGAEHTEGRFVYPRMGPGGPTARVATPDAAFVVRDGELVPAPFLLANGRRTRRMNPWAVVRDWFAGADSVRVAGLCDWRDQLRLVLEAPGEHGTERLFLDRDSGFPVGMERTVPHATWGQQRVAYVWSTWIGAESGGWFPSASFRLTDGRVERERTVGTIRRVPADSISLASLPEAPPMSTDPWLEAYAGVAPDTVRVGEGVWLLTHRMYNGGLVAVGDTVYVLDATLNESRARQDARWVERLFPDHDHVRVVVTDLAWPHVGGVRFWVARGATIVSHEDSEAFLGRLVERRWTVRPDSLERARSGARLDFLPVPPEGLELGGGAVRLAPIDGIGGEGAVMAWIPRASFLWAGDYVQTVDGPSLYAGEVIRAARREGIRPSRVAAQHVPLTDWREVVGANGG